MLHHRLSSSKSLEPLHSMAGIHALPSMQRSSDTVHVSHHEDRGCGGSVSALPTEGPLDVDELCRSLLCGTGETALQLPLSSKQHLAVQYRASKKTLLWDCVMQWAEQQSLDTVAGVL